MDDVICYVSGRLGIPVGTVKATVLIETITAAFEMEEILYELRRHSAGLNAGRWDYIFSFIKKLRNHSGYVLPDRSQVTMTAPFMHAYTELGVATCHRRGAHAMGGMAAFIPNRRDPEVTERALAAVAADKRREAEAGCDGTWVAHPDLIPVAMAEFDRVLGDRPNQIGRRRDDVAVTAEDLLNPEIAGGAITEGGVRTNVSVGIRYMASWLTGVGAAAIDNLMEDAATAEISRSQIWQWVRHGARLEDGTAVTAPMVREVAAGELSRIRETLGGERYRAGRFDRAWEIFSEVALEEEFVEFLTLPPTGTCSTGKPWHGSIQRGAPLPLPPPSGKDRDQGHQGHPHPGRSESRLHPGSGRALPGDPRQSRRRLPVHQPRQPGGGGDQRHRRAGTGEHRGTGLQAGDGGERAFCSSASPTSTSSTWRSTRRIQRTWSGSANCWRPRWGGSTWRTSGPPTAST